MTPERKIKKAISALLRSYEGASIYYHMPVQTGYGSSTLDYIGFCRGHGFAIEAKRPGGHPTDRQKGTIAAMEAAGAAVFVIDGPDGMQDLAQWLELHGA